MICTLISLFCSYKYTLGLLNQMFKTLAAHAESYSDWAFKVNRILKADQDNKSGKSSNLQITGRQSLLFVA